ncbi:MAG: hypothetical protein ACLPRE_01640, partial [Limisphaerales bacterium]
VKNWHGICRFRTGMMNQRTGQPKRILVVDDEPLVRYTVQLLLRDEGYIVEEAESGIFRASSLPFVTADEGG